MSPSADPTCRILIVEDDPIIAAELQSILEAEPDLTVVRAVQTGRVCCLIA